ncbi:MAG TPA: FkbM family methyltransferase [Candidatus Paceibacterota bacterium]|nr:FkbM family methyltransferase [Candidatus Paceibacterota bacterium]
MSTFPAALKALVKLALGKGVRKSYGQFGEDALVQALLRGNGGTYVDIGAYHPTLYSNTYALYKRGWRGIVVDPNKDMAGLYKTLRPRDRFVHAAVGRAGTGIYYRFSDAAYNTMSAEEAEKRKHDPKLQFLGTAEVPVKPLSEVITLVPNRSVDFLNIDVEGKDLEVLESHDWNVRPSVIAVEAGGFNPDTPQSSRIYAYLHSHGYSLVGLAGMSLIFRNSGPDKQV